MIMPINMDICDDFQYAARNCFAYKIGSDLIFSKIFTYRFNCEIVSMYWQFVVVFLTTLPFPIFNNISYLLKLFPMNFQNIFTIFPELFHTGMAPATFGLFSKFDQPSPLYKILGYSTS